MDTRYVFFYTAKAAIFQIYAFVVFLLLLLYVSTSLDVSRGAVVLGSIVYIGVVVAYAFYIDGVGRGNRGA